MDRIRKMGCWLVPGLLTFAVHFLTLKNGFVFDDEIVLERLGWHGFDLWAALSQPRGLHYAVHYLDYAESNRYRDRALVHVHPYVRGTFIHDRLLRTRLCRPKRQTAIGFTPVEYHGCEWSRSFHSVFFFLPATYRSRLS